MIGIVTSYYRKQPSSPSLFSIAMEKRGPKLSLITDISLSITMERDVPRVRDRVRAAVSEAEGVEGGNM